MRHIVSSLANVIDTSEPGIVSAPSGSVQVQTFTGSALGGFTSGNKVQSAAGATQAFAPGSTMWIILQGLGVGGGTTEIVLSCTAGSNAKGWMLTRQAGTGALFLLAGNGSFVQLFTPPVNGIIVACLVWRASDSHVLYSVGGSAAPGGGLIDAGACAQSAAVDSSCTSAIGTGNGVFSSSPLTSARVIAYAIQNSEASAATAKGLTFIQTSRYVLPAGATSGAVVDFNAARDFNAAGFSTQGSSPVTFGVTGSPALTAVGEMRIAPPSSLHWDGKQAISHTTTVNGAPFTYVIRDSYSRLRMMTDGLYIGVEGESTMFQDHTDQASVGLWVNGAYKTFASFTQVGPQAFDLQPGTGTGKACDVWDGSQILNTIDGVTIDGSVGTAVRLPTLLTDGTTSANSSVTHPVAPQHRGVVVGDSIMVGFNASNNFLTSLAALLRADFPTSGTGGVTIHATGSLAVMTLAADAATATASAAIIAQELDGTVSNFVWLALGTNDYGLLGEDAKNPTPATSPFGLAYARLVDAIHAASPGTTFFCESPIQRIAPATEAANSAGSTCGDFRTAIAAVVAARPAFCTYVEGAAGAIVSNANMASDGIHVLDAGEVQMHDTIKTTTGY